MQASKNKQIAINLISSIISFGVNFGISFFLTPYIVDKIGSETYGFVGLANNFTQYASIFSAALNSMAGRFISVSYHKNDKVEVEKYVSSVFFANLLMALPLTILSVFIIGRLDRIVQISANVLPDVQILWIFIFFNFLLSLVTSVFSVATFTKNRPDISSKISIVSNIIRAVILIVLFAVFRPLIWYIGLATIAAAIFSRVSEYIVYKKLFPEIKISPAYVEAKKILTLISSGIWVSVSQMCSVALEELDLLITNLFVNAASMGMVSLAKTIPVKLLAFFVMFGNAFSPQITIDYAKKDYEAVKEDALSAIRLISFCSSIPLACLYAFGKEFFQLWVPGENATQLYVIAILACLEFPLVVPLEPMWKIFAAANKNLQTAIVAIITAILSVSLTFGLLAITENEFTKMCIIVGVSSTIGLLRGGLFLPLYGSHCIGLKWYTFYPVLLKNLIGIGLGTAIALAFRQIFTIDSWTRFIISVVVVSAIMMTMNFFLLLRKKERKELLQKLRKIVG